MASIMSRGKITREFSTRDLFRGNNFSGFRYGNILIIERSFITTKGTYWRYKCDCGKYGYISRMHIGHYKSCGCLQYKKDFKGINFPTFKHGKTESRAYNSWESMKQRCLNKNSKSFFGYGGRGITICESWFKFENFYRDMGERPLGMSLDRIDNNGNYEPSNCKWSTQKQQMRNTRSTRFIRIGGVEKSVSDWSDFFGLKPKRMSDLLQWGNKIDKREVGVRSYQGRSKDNISDSQFKAI